MKQAVEVIIKLKAGSPSDPCRPLQQYQTTHPPSDNGPVNTGIETIQIDEILMRTIQDIIHSILRHSILSAYKSTMSLANIYHFKIVFITHENILSIINVMIIKFNNCKMAFKKQLKMNISQYLQSCTDSSQYIYIFFLIL